MNPSIDTLRKVRATILNVISGLTAEQLNKIPEGFNNNIIWNLAHMVSAQQGICYGRAQLDVTLEDKYYFPYRPETKPADFIADGEIEIIKGLMQSTLDQLETDAEAAIFVNYPSFTTRYGVTLSSIDDAIKFLPFHDGLHIGAIQALRKFV